MILTLRNMSRAPTKQIPEFAEKDTIRFWSYVAQRPDGIWAWVGPKNKSGHGTFRIGKSVVYAHRAAWALSERSAGRSGFIPDELRVLHKKDVTAEMCDVNPANLWLGTMKDNTRDMFAKGRGNRATGDKNGAKTHPESRRRGEQTNTAKLTEDKVVEIRRYGEMGYTLRCLAEMFSVSHGAICRVLLRRTWKHVA
jgi:hypothetical protein